MVEAIGQLRDAIRTGLSVPDAFVGLARGGPVAMRPELTTLVREMRLMGFEPAVGAMREHLGRITEILERIRTTHAGHFAAEG